MNAADQQPAQSNVRGAGWGQNRRLEFIDFRLLWEGRINRSDLVEFFGISTPQASLDLARYQELAPNNVRYDHRERVYFASQPFEPFFTVADPSRYLNSLLGVNLGMVSKEMSFIGWYPSFDAVLSPTRKISGDTLYRALGAIRNRRALEVSYQSLNRTEPTIRQLSPHAIAYDGFRWHTRAYCHERKDFRDFVFPRILEIRSESPSDIDPAADLAWTTFLTLELIPHPGLPPAQRRVIELDYGMTEGILTIQVRKALLFYALRRLNLHKGASSAQAQQIALANERDLALHLKDVE
jgi:hypothetical protein